MRGRLRALRVGLACLCGALFAGLFLGPAAVALPLAGWLPRLQAGPALVRLFSGVWPAAALVLGAIVLVTALCGRLYCAVWCPLGLLQDAARFALRRVPALRRRQDRWAGTRGSGLGRCVGRWAVLAAVAGTALAGTLTLAVLLEPYSLAGRIAEHLFLPVVTALRGGLARVLERLDLYAFSAGAVAAPPVLVAAVSGLCLAALAALVVLGGRLYCTAICPVGTCLGLLAQAAPVRVRVDPSLCTRCGLCARRCRAACIRVGEAGLAIDQAACVACMDCVAACPQGALRYGLPAPAAAQPERAEPRSAVRRELVAGGSAAVLAAGLSPLRLPGAGPSARGRTRDPVTPPGSGSRERFATRCTACQLCVRVCPTRVLQPAWLEYGLGGVLQPRLSFRHGFCEYDCQRCSAVCPNGALRPLPLAEKQRTQLGVARLHKNRCVVYSRGEACGACIEVCPTHAVHPRDEGGLLCPEMEPAPCIGCGACEYACPMDPKAIEVHACAVHGRAQPPHAVETVPAAVPAGRTGASPDADFPF